MTLDTSRFSAAADNFLGSGGMRVPHSLVSVPAKRSPEFKDSERVGKEAICLGLGEKRHYMLTPL